MHRRPTGFFQTLLDLTVEEALVKYGFRYSTRGGLGAPAAAVRRALAFKLVGAVLARRSCSLRSRRSRTRSSATTGSTAPLLVAALLPLAQAPEGVGRRRADPARPLRHPRRLPLRLDGAALRGDRDRRAVRRDGDGGRASSSRRSSRPRRSASPGWLAFRRFPAAPRARSGRTGRRSSRFVVQSSLATGVVSLRTALAPLAARRRSRTAPRSAYFRAAQAPQQGLAALAAPARMILLTEQTRDWERGRRASACFAGVRRYTLGAALLVRSSSCRSSVAACRARPTSSRREYVGAADAARIVLVAGALQFVCRLDEVVPGLDRPARASGSRRTGSRRSCSSRSWSSSAREWGATGAAVAVLVSTRRVRARLDVAVRAHRRGCTAPVAPVARRPCREGARRLAGSGRPTSAGRRATRRRSPASCARAGTGSRS